ncbi:MAG: hypothetical protein NPIRA02_35310 [Nitrospirales bacterium]|nr:MAG: hypothetical protein NPIRA02_35310 [Nitrospirales bacterium]
MMNQGDNRRTVFTTDKQCQYFVALLADASDRFNAEWHAYCLMDNHYHLILLPRAFLEYKALK